MDGKTEHIGGFTRLRTRLANDSGFRYRTVMCIAAPIIFFVTLAIVYIQSPVDDVINFFHQGTNLKNGLLPYSDFEFEFPPLAVYFFTIPALFTNDLDTYARLFALMCALLMIVAVHFILKVGENFRNNAPCLAAITFILSFLCYIQCSVQKFDPIVMSFTVISVYFFAKKNWCAAYVFMTFAAMVKIYPAIFIALMLAYNICINPGEKRTAVFGILICAVVTVLLFAPLWISGVTFSESISFISFHSDRGFHIESTVAALSLVLGRMGLFSTEIVPAHYTYDVLSPMADFLLPIWMPICGLCIFASLVYCILNGPRKVGDWNAQNISLAMFVLCGVFVLTNKVFSTQYLMWMFPFAAMFWYAFTTRQALVNTTAFVLIIIFSRVYPCIGMDSIWFPVLILIRDVLILYLVVASAIRLRSLKRNKDGTDVEDTAPE